MQTKICILLIARRVLPSAYKEKKIVDEANALAKKIEAMEVKISSKVGSGDKLFGSVNAQDLADAITAKGEEMDKKFISIPGKTIKRLGKYTASIRLHRDVNIEFPFEVVPE